MRNMKTVFSIVTATVMIFTVFSSTMIFGATTGINNQTSYGPQNLIFEQSPLPNVTGNAAFESINGGPLIEKSVFVHSGPASSETPIEGEYGYSDYGVLGANMGNGGITNAYLAVNFSAFSGEADTYWGNNAWSIQLNANYFTGSNNANDWVQFVFQNNIGNPGQYIFAIWNIDLSTKNYTSIGAQIPEYYLSTSVTYGMYGYVSGGKLWSEFTIDYSNGTNYAWYLTTADTYGLAGRWYDASGTILGAGGGSYAQFSSPVAEYTTISATPYYNPYDDLDYVTGEGNNMIYNGGWTYTSTSGGVYQVFTQST
jgi:hypothetical protein